MRESLDKYNKLLNEQTTSYKISADWCNGYGDWSCSNTWPIGGTYGACDPNGDPWPDYQNKTLTWSAVSDIGGQTPQVGMYIKYRNLAWYVKNVTPISGSGGISLNPHPGGNLCSSKFVCGHDLQGNPNCTQVGLSHEGTSFFATGNEFGSMEYCQDNCSQINPPPPPPNTTCTTNIPGLNIIKPLNQSGLSQPGIQNLNPPPTDAECVMEYFVFDSSTQTLKLKGCNSGFSGSMDLTISGPGGFNASNFNNYGTEYVVPPTISGNYTAKIECEYTQGIDSHTVCIGGDHSSGFSEISCSNTGTLEIDKEYRGPSEPTNPNIGAKKINPEDDEISRIKELF
tara:strand:- start:3546 stop:4568 length:1023 start_codon:yes stop_codon:yes gene_type:complete